MSANPDAVELLKRRMKWQQIAASGRPAEVKVALLASFTIDMLQPYLGVALEEEGLPADVWVGPYNQILQECLTPGSRTEEYAPDYLVVCPRLEELWSGRPLPRTAATGAAAEVDYHHEALQLADVCASAARRLSARLLFVLPPVPEERPLGVGDAGDVDGVVSTATAVREALRRRLAGRPGVLLADLDVLVRRLGTERSYNPAMLVFGHIPFSDDLFLALGGEIARLVGLRRGIGRRLAVLDADGVVWGGRLAELGAAGVDLAGGGPGLAHRQLQSHLLERRRSGLRLALVSPAPEDAVAAALCRPEMRLRREHLDAVETGGASPDAQVRDVAEKLGVALEEVVWLCAEEARRAAVADALSDVAVVALPEDVARWRLTLPAERALDRLPLPSPKAASSAAGVSLEAFLASLELRVSFDPLGPDAARKIVDMQQQISEFNVAAAVRTVEEVAADLDGGTGEVLAVRVRDRFDDYGVAGLVRATRAEEALEVDTLLLNCRVLGKRVEAFLLERLAEDATSAGLAHLRIRYRPTDRNAPVLDWLRRVDGDAVHPWEDGWTLDVTAERAFAWARGQQEVFTGSPAAGEPAAAAEPEAPAEDAAAPVGSAAPRHVFRPRGGAAAVTAVDLGDAEAILAAVRAEKRRATAPGSDAAFVASRTPTEEMLTAIWTEVLHRDTVGVYDNFFRLGGHSLLATRVLSRLRDAFGVELPLKTVFEAPTPAAMAERVERARRDGSLPASPDLEPMPRSGPLPLSFAQRRLWTLDQLEPGSTGYNMQVGLRLRGPLERSAMELALRRLVERHESLRTTFTEEDGEGVQVVAETLELPFENADLTAEDPARRTAAVRRLAAGEAARAFDLERGPLFRLTLIRQDDDDHVLLLTLHHIIGDVWSLGVFFQELMADYVAARGGTAAPLEPLPVQVGDFAVWQRRWMEGDVLAAHLDFWSRRLEGAPRILELPTDHPRPDALSHRNGRLGLELPEGLARRLREMGGRYGATVFMTLFAAFATLLSRWSRQRNLLVGMPIANRNRTELERLIGFVANTLVLRADLKGRPSFGTLLERIREYVLAVVDYQDVPFESLVKELRPPRDPSRNPLFQVMFAFHNVPPPEMAGSDLVVESVDLERGLNPFDIFLHLWEEEDGELGGSLSYSLDLFERPTAERLLADFVTVLEAVVESSEAPLEELLDGRVVPPGTAVASTATAAGAAALREAPYVAPRNDREAALVAIWEEVLQRERIGVDDNFFFVGGDSILALRLIARARQEGLALVPRQIMRHQTVAALAAKVGEGSPGETPEPQGPATGEVVVTPSQGFFFALELANRDYFNQVFYGELLEEVEPRILERAFAALPEHHDGLRLRFTEEDGTWRSRYTPPDGTSPLEVVDLGAEEEERWDEVIAETEARLHRRLRLAAGPTFSAVLFTLPEGRRDRLMIFVHHIVTDGVSWGVLMEDLELACRQLERGDERPVLPPKTASIQRWAEVLRKASGSEEVRGELGFWTGRKWAESPLLPVDHEGGANLERHVTLLSETLTVEATQTLLRRVPELGSTDVADLLLAAVVESLAEWTGRRTLSVCLTRNGRHLPWGDLDTSRTVGWLVHIFPVLLELDGTDDLLAAGRLVHDHLQTVPRQGLGFGLLRFLADDAPMRERMASIPMPQLLFNYFGKVDASGVGSSLLLPIERGRPEIHDPGGVREFQLIVNTLVDDDRLRFNCTFSDQLYEPATLKQRLDVAVELLENLAHKLGLEGETTRLGDEEPEPQLVS